MNGTLARHCPLADTGLTVAHVEVVGSHLLILRYISECLPVVGFLIQSVRQVRLAGVVETCAVVGVVLRER